VNAPAAPLPALAPMTPMQLFVAGVWVTTAALLLVTLAVRIVRGVDLLQWWVPVSFVAGIALADLASGLVHWGADTWGRADLPFIGPRLLVPFRVHHINPEDFVHRVFLDTNGDVALLAIPVLTGLVLLPLDGRLAPLAVFGLGLCSFGVLTNQIHQWAHMPVAPAPVRVLQRAGILLSPVDHAEHHSGKYDRHYAITTGWWNRPLEKIQFFRRAEQAISRSTGATPRSDESTIIARGGQINVG
jgi:ubiquitin-conjugating enzyme E2 variant